MRRRRRGRGEGTVYYNTAKSLYAGSLPVGRDERGKARAIWVYAKTQGEVIEKLDRLRAHRSSGVLVEPSRETIAIFLWRWLDDEAKSANAIRPSTALMYRRIIQRHLVPYIGGVRLTRLEPKHVKHLLGDLERQGASPRKRQIVFGVLHNALGSAVREGMIARNVCDAVTRPRAPRPEMRIWTAEQANEFLRAARVAWEAREDRFWPLYVLALTTGLRRGELFGLCWDDVDLKDAAVHVRRQLTDNNGHPMLSDVKTGRARRRVDIPKTTVDALRAHRERMFAEGHLHGEGNPLALVFCDTTGRPLRASNVLRRSFYPLVRRAGMPRIRFHDLRHSAASLLLRQGTHPKVVQERLGHHSVALTLDTYSHIVPSMQREAADKLDAIFSTHI